MRRAASCCVVLRRAASCCVVLRRAASCCVVLRRGLIFAQEKVQDSDNVFLMAGRNIKDNIKDRFADVSEHLFGESETAIALREIKQAMPDFEFDRVCSLHYAVLTRCTSSCWK
jgi:hypothetical protein